MKRDMSNKIIAGVCSGLANDCGLDPTIVRLIFALCFLFFGFGPLIYIILWILMPKG